MCFLVTVLGKEEQGEWSDCRIPGPAIYMCRCALKNEVHNNSCYSYSMQISGPGILQSSQIGENRLF